MNKLFAASNDEYLNNIPSQYAHCTPLLQLYLDNISQTQLLV